MSKYLDEKVMMINIDEKDCYKALEVLANELHSNGYVKESYIDAIKIREENFATGLPSEGVGVAIPHADIEHVNTPIIGVGVLNNPVKFRMMGNHDEDIDVEIMFMLALNEHHAQLQMLQNLITLIQDKDLLLSIKNSSNVEGIMSILEDKF